MVMKIDWINWRELPEGLFKSFAELFSSKKSNEIITNVFTEASILKINNDFYFPVTKNDAPLKNSFVCSPYTAYALYSKDELTSKVPNRILQLPLLWLIKLIDVWLKFGNIDKNVHINNFLLSTNPYPDWDGKQIAGITELVKSKFPQHAIIFRSLNLYQHEHLLSQFEINGYHKIGSRQVYIYDEDYEAWYKHKNNKHDKRIIKKQQLQYIGHEEMEAYLEQALELYNKLYLIKYSKYNPQFTLAYFQFSHKSRFMHFQGYVDDNRKLKAFSGLFILGKTITSPLVGYDTDAPQKEGLYIHAINLIMQYKFNHGLLLNLSSGASLFKRLRGGKPSIEYSVVYTGHLSLKRRLTWTILQFISNKIGIPLMNKYEL